MGIGLDNDSLWSTNMDTGLGYDTNPDTECDKILEIRT